MGSKPYFIEGIIIPPTEDTCVPSGELTVWSEDSWPGDRQTKPLELLKEKNVVGVF